MEKDRFEYLRVKSEEGREDVFVNHPSTNEQGVVQGARGESLLVKTPSGEEKSWDYRECEETLSRREQFPYR